MKKKALLFAGAVMILLQICCYFGLSPMEPKFYVNISKSQPLGLYRVVSVKPDSLHDGDLVIMQVPDNMKSLVAERNWLPKDYTLLKTVYALPGESYSITDQEITVNEQYVGRVLDKDSSGRPLPILRGSFIVQPGNFLPLATRVINSFDGRYFGEIPTNLVVAKVVPFILFPEGIL